MAVTLPGSWPAALKEFLSASARQTLFLDFTASAIDQPLATKLTGQPYMPPGESWPTCPGCQQPLHHLFQFNFEQAAFPILEGVALLSFFYCLTCAPYDSDGSGWRVLIRKETALPPESHPLPPVPPQEEQPGPVILLVNRVQLAETRVGPDLPDSLTAELAPLLFEELRGEPGERRVNSQGCDRLISGWLLDPTTGERTYLEIPCTPATDPTIFAEAIGLEEMRVRTLPLGYDYSDEYYAYLCQLRHSPDWQVVSKLGGWLSCEQDARIIHCGCGAEMEHFATVKTKNETPFVIYDIGSLYLVACPNPNCADPKIGWWLDWT